jgi:regulator of nonsense transcripts 1
MFDAKEAMVSRGGAGPPFYGNERGPMMGGPNQWDMFRGHDSISYISNDRAQAALSGMAVPVGMFMNMTNNMPPPRYFQQQQQQVKLIFLV